MSNEQFGEKTEQPTPHRLREARRKGQVVKSSELNSAFNLLAMSLLFILFGSILFIWMQEMIRRFLEQNLLTNVSMDQLRRLITVTGLDFFKITGFIFTAAVVVGLVINYVQVGFISSLAKLTPTWDKLNPVEGLKRIFSRRAVFELAKALIKIALVGLLVYSFFVSRFETFFGYMFYSPGDFFNIFTGEIMDLTLRVAAVFLVLAVLDYLYQRWEYFKTVRMTKQEVKEEFKQMEGDPLMRSKLREKQRMIANHRMIHEVPQATVVITNPTELAVALKYSSQEAPVPVVVAKGAGFIAARMREVAREHQVPVIENKYVARMLYAQVEIGQVIPVGMYQSVAEILALVYEINKEQGRV